ncbi:MAG: rhodanese-like domain-containing protein, partial [Ferruginibacter sp.]
MKKICLLICFAMLTGSIFAQYKNDNVLYKTVYMQDLCNELNNNPGALFLDVRTAGEYADTSARGSNIGRFKNAVNIEVSELGARIAELNAYKDKPIFIYCSHSQRSRRAGKMLVDSGFTKVFNVNGGMTGLRQMPVKDNACVYAQLESNSTYNIISAADLCTKISAGNKNIFLLDVRNDSA